MRAWSIGGFMKYHEKVDFDLHHKSLAALWHETPEAPFDIGLAEDISHEIPSCPLRREMLGDPPTLREHLMTMRERNAKKEFLAHYNERMRQKLAAASKQSQTVGV